MKKQTKKTSSKQTNKKNVKFKFDAKSDVIQKQNIKFEGEDMEIKTIFNPKKPDLTIKERR